jgi:hypothetical protein
MVSNITFLPIMLLHELTAWVLKCCYFSRQSIRQVAPGLHHPPKEEPDRHGQPAPGSRHPAHLLLRRVARQPGCQDRVRQHFARHQY